VPVTGGRRTRRSFIPTPPSQRSGHDRGRRGEHLRAVLDVLTAGTVLHLLAEVVREDGSAARRSGDDTTADRFQHVTAILFVVVLGIDAALPH
jgi:hypothetical protein